MVKLGYCLLGRTDTLNLETQGSLPGNVNDAKVPTLLNHECVGLVILCSWVRLTYNSCQRNTKNMYYYSCIIFILESEQNNEKSVNCSS